MKLRKKGVTVEIIEHASAFSVNANFDLFLMLLIKKEVANIK